MFLILLLAAICTAPVAVPKASGDDLPEGVSNSQNPADISLSPEESLKRITVPDGIVSAARGKVP